MLRDQSVKLQVMLMLLGAVLGGCSMASHTRHAATPATTQAESARVRLMASEGGQLVLRAIEAHGGLETWYNTRTSAFAWEYSNAGMDFRFKSYQVADNRTRLIYHELQTLGTCANPEPATGSFAWNGTDAWIHPAAIKAINPRFWATTPYYFQLIPFLLADPGLRYTMLPKQELDGVFYDMVRVGYKEGVGDSPGDTYTLYVDQRSGLVRAIRYTVTYFSGQPPSEEAPKRETLFYYEGYVTVDGLTVPTRFRGFLFQDGQMGEFKNEAWASDISFNGSFDADKLVAPAGGRVQAPPPRP